VSNKPLGPSTISASLFRRPSPNLDATVPRLTSTPTTDIAATLSKRMSLWTELAKSDESSPTDHPHGPERWQMLAIPAHSRQTSHATHRQAHTIGALEPQENGFVSAKRSPVTPLAGRWSRPKTLSRVKMCQAGTEYHGEPVFCC
jgi:hypothetical protein